MLNIAVILEFNCGLGQMSAHLTLDIPDVKFPGSPKKSTGPLDYIAQHLERV